MEDLLKEYDELREDCFPDFDEAKQAIMVVDFVA